MFDDFSKEKDFARRPVQTKLWVFGAIAVAFLVIGMVAMKGCGA